MTVAITVLSFLSALSTVADVQALLEDLLQGGNTTVVDCQRMLSQTLGWTAISPSGVLLSGKLVSVRDKNIADLAEEVGEQTPIFHYFAAFGYGPEPLRVYVPTNQTQGDLEAYQRIEPGVFLRVEPLRRIGNYAVFDIPFPGDVIVCHPTKQDHLLEKALAPQGPPPSTDPALKEKWRFYRAAPETVAGPIPLILIHGLTTD